MDNEQYYKEAMNKLTNQQDKDELELWWGSFNSEGTYTPIEFKNGAYSMGSGYLCWEFPQWLEAACRNNIRLLKTLGLTGKYLKKIELLCRLRDLPLTPKEVEQWTDTITQDNADVSKIDLALKNIQVIERKQALDEDFKA